MIFQHFHTIGEDIKRENTPAQVSSSG